MNIIIIDDDLEFGDILKDKLTKIYPRSRVRIFDEYLDGIINESDNILFLDVLLEDEESFALGEKLSHQFPNLLLVYISSNDHFVYDSYRQKTFFFIRKSRLDKDLADFNIKYEKLFDESEITISYQNTDVKLKHKDIIYVESLRNKICICTHYQIYEIYMSLIQFEKLLNSKLFYRFNSHMILNLNHVQHIDKKYVELNNGKRIEYTRNSKKNFIMRYALYRSGEL